MTKKEKLLALVDRSFDELHHDGFDEEEIRVATIITLCKKYNSILGWNVVVTEEDVY